MSSAVRSVYMNETRIALKRGGKGTVIKRVVPTVDSRLTINCFGDTDPSSYGNQDFCRRPEISFGNRHEIG